MVLTVVCPPSSTKSTLLVWLPATSLIGQRSLKCIGTGAEKKTLLFKTSKGAFVDAAQYADLGTQHNPMYPVYSNYRFWWRDWHCSPVMG